MAGAAANPRHDAAMLTGVQRAAILVMYLEPGVARTLLEQLSTEEIQAIGMAMAGVDRVDPEVIELVVAEFIRGLYEASMVPRTGQDFALSVLPDLIDPDRRPQIVGSLRRELSSGFSDFVASCPPTAVAMILQDEHPQTQAIALLLMGSEVAGAVLDRLDEHERLDIARRMTRIQQIPGEFADAVEESIRTALSGKDHSRWSVKGIDRTARALGRMETERQTQTLERISEEDRDLSDLLRRRMVAFADLATMDDRAMQVLLKSCTRETLALALRGVEPAVRDTFFRNMSTRAAEDLADEIELLGPTPRQKIEGAREELVQVALRLRDEGTIEFGGSADDLV